MSLVPRIEAVLKLLNGVKVRTFLDLGCSDGSITLEIAKKVCADEIYGVDIDDVALERARARGIKVFKCDLSRDKILLPDESVDLVTALEVIEHLLNPES